MLNWRVFSEFQDEEPQPKVEFELSLSQLPEEPLLPRDLPTPFMHLRDEALPSRLPNQPRIEQRWHGNLQRDARVLVILLQVRRVEPGSHEVTFEGCFEGLNDDQYYCMVKPIKGSRGHQQCFEGLVNPLMKTDCAEYVAATIKRILKFLQME